ncbi:MAG: DUF2076 domain-containing protein [Hyphomicrobiales bacterium]|nr:DUF2076 family protein [Hyphomicrobiales bacterium]MDE2018420.1 DUF2076 domain-containing protein [Hyphomicrobiales bacterium]
MSPEERNVIDGLFARIQGAAQAPRDPEAEAHIIEALRAQPYAPYVMTQTLLVQQHALEAAQARIAELEAQPAAPPPSFLGGLGKSLFGAGVAAAPPRVYRPAAAPQPEPYAPPQGGAQGGPWSPSAQPQSGPWGGAPAGGGFLQQALRTATGVAGGMLAADAISSLFRGGPFGGGNQFGGLGGGAQLGGFGGQNAADAQALRDYDAQQDAQQDAQDDGSSSPDPSQDASFDSSGDSGGDSGGGFDV